MGLHKRYADLLGSKLPSVTLANSPEDNYRIQARKWASIISDPELRELAEEAAELVLRKGFDLPEIVEKDLGKRRNGITLASYQSGVFPKIYINTNKQIKKLGGIKKIREAAVERGWSSQPNTILHELAHHMDYVMQENYRSTKPGDLFDKLDEEQVKKILSEYGSSEPAEFRAELYAAILAGKTFPKEFLEAAYLTTYPDDRTHILYQMGSGEIPNVSMLEREFGNMMEALFTEDGTSLRIDILGKDEVQGFIQEHANVLGSSLGTADMSELMRSRLEESNYIFSGIKAFHELNEAFPSLLDEEGKRKPFERFLNDVQSIDETYNKHYLNAEYNFAQASAEMAGKWERFTEDGDDYLLQYRTANDSKVRPEHAELHGVTLPMGDSFWDEYYPPNGWNCRCTVVQVLKSKHEQTPHAEAMQRAEQALLKDTKGMFHFNSGKTGKSFPDHNPYTLRRCTTCDLTKLNLASDATDNDVCAACRLVHECYKDRTRASEQKRIEENRKLYDKLSKDKRYKDVEFDPKTGALKATHVGHNGGSDDGFKLEKKLVDSLYACGHSVILCDEQKKGKNGQILTSLDMILDGVRMDIKSITKNKAHYGSAIRSKNNQLTRYNRRTDVHKAADTICMYFDDPTMFAPKKIRDGYEYMKSKTSGDIHVRRIICFINSAKGLETKTFEFE